MADDIESATTLTVRELMIKLSQCSPDAEVRIAYDSDYAYTDAKGVDIESDAFVYITSQPVES